MKALDTRLKRIEARLAQQVASNVIRTVADLIANKDPGRPVCPRLKKHVARAMARRNEAADGYA